MGDLSGCRVLVWALLALLWVQKAETQGMESSWVDTGAAKGSRRMDTAQQTIFIQSITALPTMSALNPAHNGRVCSTWGDFHYKTFDGDIFRFPGRCNYVFSAHCGAAYEDFNVQLRRGLAGSRPTITHVVLKAQGLVLEVSNSSVLINGRREELPYSQAGLLVEQSSDYIKVNVRLMLTFMWNGEDSALLELDPKYANQTCGLCGDFNGLPAVNEFYAHNARLTPLQFGNLQKLDGPTEQCQDPQPSPADNCTDREGICHGTLLGPAFTQCNWLVDADPYVAACTQDLCRCPTCPCATFAEYSRQCAHAGGQPQNWRRPDFCPRTCPLNTQHQECGSPCADTCSNPERSQLCEDHCVDGCFCPPGTVLDDVTNSGCLPLEHCPCTHGGRVYAPGASFSTSCSSCTCSGGLWQCQDHPCPGTCSVQGGSHISTYDERLYDMHGDCSYVLSKKCEDNGFTVLAELRKCGLTDNENCLKTVTLSMSGGATVIRIQANGGVFMNSIFTQLPVSAANITVFRPSTFFILVQTGLGLQLEVQLVPLMQVFLRLDPAYRGQMCGLCGNFNQNQADDFLTLSGVVEGTAAAFANTWKTQAACPNVKNSFEDPCSLSVENEKYAQHWCSLLTDPAGAFSPCHSIVNPAPFHSNCLFDTCNCEKSEDCLCAALSAYVRACAAKGVLLSGWRAGVCTKYMSTCPKSQIYAYVVESCQPTCQALSQADVTCGVPFVPVDGCTCPRGTFLDDAGSCVPAEACPCYFRGSVVAPGEVVHDNGVVCSCESGKLSCLGALEQTTTGCAAPMVYLDCGNASAGAPGAECLRSCHTLDVDCFSTHCVSGCVCPPGLVSDGSGGCVAEEDCPCLHNDAAYRPGDTIRVDCNTCTCRNRRWECSQRPCLGTCVTYGDGHFITFDAERYSFAGSCEYTLAQDYCGGNGNTSGTFRIVTENIPCGTTGVTCSKAIKLFLENYELILHEGNYKVVQRGPGTDLPYRIRYMGTHLAIETRRGLVVSWDRRTSVFIRLHQDYKGKVCGLCGNFDDNAVNDFTTRSQSVVGDALEFGNSWKFSPTCPDAPAPKDPCIANPYRKSWAQKQCSLINSPTFEACHSQVDSTKYYEACVSDACACDSGGDCECFCTAVAAYAQACRDVGVCVSWRTPEVCPLFCDYYNPQGECEWHYQPCGSPCLKTCRNPSGRCLMDLPGQEGCYPKCPPSKPFFSEDQMRCVAQCGCYDDDGNYYDVGAPVPTEENCQSCACTPEGIRCAHSLPACTCTYEGRTYGYGDVIYNTTDGLGACLIAVCGDNGTIIRKAVDCPGTPSTTPFAFTSTSSSTAAPPATTGPVPTLSTVCVRELCRWSDWYDSGRPEPGMGGGDFETFANLRQRGHQVCPAPARIQCRARLLPDTPLEQLGQKVECDPQRGLLCLNSEQNPPFCHNYELRVLCCDYVPCSTPPSPGTSQQPTPRPLPPSTIQATTAFTSQTTETQAATCQPRCQWTEWFDEDYPKSEEAGGDIESYDKIRSAGGSVCERPRDIECRAEHFPNRRPEELGQLVHCDPGFGLVCRNDEQIGLFKMCYNYRIRLLCCSEDHCGEHTTATATPATSTATATAATTTVTATTAATANASTTISMATATTIKSPATSTWTQPGSSPGVTQGPLSSTTAAPFLSTGPVLPATSSNPSHTDTLMTSATRNPTSPSGSTKSTTLQGTLGGTSQEPTLWSQTTQTSTAHPSTKASAGTLGTVSMSPPSPSHTRTNTQRVETSQGTQKPMVTTEATTSQGTTGCEPKCEWTEWFDVDFPTSGVTGGDMETYDNIRAAGSKMCQEPQKIECRAESYPEVSLDQIGQVVTCSLRAGLVCRNQDQKGPFSMCFNYNIRVLCCDHASHCPTSSTPLPVTSTQTLPTTATTKTQRSSPRITDRITIPTAETGLSTSRTTEKLSVPSPSASPASPIAETTSTLLGTTPGPDTATSTATGPSATAQTTHILTSGPTTSAATATGCQPRCTWTGWLDQSYPMSEASGGDFETYANIRAAGGSVCERPVALQCRAERLPDVPLQELDQVVQCDLDVGLVCRNQDQGGRFKMCLNYQIRVLCCDDYSHCPSTPKPGTTATLSTTERLSVPSSSPSATSPTPETTSALLGTTPGPYTATSTATGPSATAQTTPILTSGPTTSAATATGCQPRCTWTGWLDQSYPMSGASGGDFETYANIRAAGGSVCERPVALQCRAERLPDVPLQELDQVVQCDLDVGLVCRNQDQGGRVKMCLNYQIRVLCCDDYSHCPSTPKPGTTATLSSTGSETAGTTGFRTTTTTPPLPSAPGTTETVSKATTETGPSSAKTERVTIPTAETGPSTSRTTQSVPGTQTPRTSLSTTERLSVPSSSPSATSPTPETTSALLGTTPGPYTATSTAMGPSATAQTTPILTSGPAATATGCQPRCTWTGWLDQSYPMSGASGGDFETYANIRAAGGSVCERPVALQCRAERLPDVPLQELDQVVQCDLDVGLVCRNQDQGGRFKMCLNYQIRVLCCDDYSHCPSTPKPGTTATLSTTERLSVPSSSPSATSPTPETTSALLGTTPGPYTATSTATGPSATAQTTPILTSGPTTSAATATGCQPRCTWTGWLDQSYPMSGASGGDFETYANIRAAGGSVCERPVALQCRAERLPDVPLQELDQVVQCDLEVGLVCRNQDQGGRFKMCLNYQIRVLCCDDYSHCPSTPKPGTTATLSSTGSETAGTTGFRTTTTTPPLPSAPGTTETVSKATTETGPSSAKTERVTIPTAETGPSTSRTTQSVPGTQTPRTSLSTTERLSVPSSSPSATSPTPETTSALLGTTPGPYTATSTAMGPSATAQTTPILTSGPAATATGCQPRCTWTGWLDQSYPMSGASGGDFETYANIRAAGGSVCERPVALQCRAERLPDVPLQELDQVVQCDLDVGLVCRNQDQGGRFKMCLNYQIRVLCCDDYSHCPSTPKPGTTATLSTTERLSVPSSSPSATSPTPETTSALLGTTPGPYTATSTATGPSATAQTTPILTSGPTTSAATATGCQPRCTWTGWLDQSYPMSGASGGDFETYANIRAAGGSVCERPVALQCRAERLPDVPLQELDQVVQCDLEVGLVCRNQDQGGRFKMCLNYQIRVLCCDDYSHCPSTPKPGTTATLSSTGSETAGTTGFRTTTTTPPLPSAPGTTETVSKATTETGPSSAKTERVTIPTAETGPSTSRTTQSVPGTQTPRTSLSTTERLSVPSSSPSATSPTPETTSTLLGTTPGPDTATSTATGPSATAQTTHILTSGPTTSAATATGCQPRCTWTGWLDQSYPMSGASGGDFETYANIRAAGGSVCERPVALQCRAERLPDVPLQELDQVVQCDLDVGLVCRNQDQGGRFKMCLNYQIRVLCCDDYSHCPSTPKPGTTATLSTTERLSVPSSSPSATSPTPETTSALLGTTPGPYTATSTATGPSATAQTTPILTSGPTTSAATATGCQPRCTWTGWLDQSYPMSGASGGDFETYANIRAAGGSVCERPVALQCRAERLPDVPLQELDQVVQCDLEVGLVCRNQDQGGRFKMCLNYQIRVLCCDDYSHCPSTPKPGTTATLSSTGSETAGTTGFRTTTTTPPLPSAPGTTETVSKATTETGPSSAKTERVTIPTAETGPSTSRTTQSVPGTQTPRTSLSTTERLSVPSSSPSATSPTPETTSTLLGTTPGPDTATSTATGPSATAQTTHILTSGPTTSAATATGCQPRCTWTGWLDQSYPMSEASGGDFETYANIRAAGGSVCERPVALQCRAERLPDVPLQELDQVVQCDLDVGLVCRNQDQGGRVKMCLNYQIRVLCCDDYSHCPSTPKPGTTATLSSTGSETAGTTGFRTTTTTPPLPSAPGTTETVSKATTETGPSSAKTERVTIPTAETGPSTSRTTQSVPGTQTPRTSLSTTERLSVPSSSPSATSPTPETTSALLGTTPGPYTATSTAMGPSATAQTTPILTSGPAATATGCQPRCTWTGWLDQSYPMSGASGGDFETYANIRAAGGSVCERPVALQCRAERLPDVPLQELDQVVQCDLDVGLVCRNQDQGGRFKMCLNYQIRVLCCDDYSHCPSTPKPGTTATLSTTERLSVPSSSPSATSPTPETTSALLGTTPGPYTATSTATGPSATAQTTPILTSGPTTSAATATGCQPRCTWTGWLDQSYPMSGASGGDFETYANIRAAGGSVCERPVALQCRAERLPDVPLQELDQVVLCDLEVGLVCRNQDQGGRFKMCLNYQIRVLCCDDYSHCPSTPKPGTTATLSSTGSETAGTTGFRTTTTTPPLPSAPGTTETVSKATTETGPSSAKTERVTIPTAETGPSTSRTTQSVPGTQTPRTSLSTTERLSVPSSSPSATSPTPETTSALLGTTPGPYTATSTAMGPSATAQTTPILTSGPAATATGCQPRCTWTGWLDQSYPMSGASGGDFETYANIRAAGGSVCERPVALQCRAERLPDVPLQELDQVVQCDLDVGLVCRNQDQGGRFKMCLNYQIRVLCCDDYSHCPSTPKPGTTATLSTTERLSVPSSSPSATSPTPETTSALLGTTPGPYTATSTATGPSATAQTTPILTSGPTTSAATATGCQPRCTWTGWLDQSYPMSGASGGDFETYANIRAAGGSVCERPVALQCRAERLPDVPLQELDQVVQCDLEVGLVCRNQDQGGRFKMCLNYQIRVLCCDDYSHCPSTPKPGTTATLSSTGSETAGTTGFRTTTTTPPLPSAPGTTETVSKATTETGPSSAKTERVTIPTAETGPSTSRTTQSVPGTQTPRTSLSTTERLSVPSSSPSATSPTPETTSTLLGTTPGPDTATSTATGPSATAQTTHILTSGPTTSAATATGCQPRCTWTGWLDQSYPMSEASGGDFETYANIRAAGGSVCERPVALQCRAERLPDVPLQELDQVVQCDLDVGLVCRNQDQGGRVKMCLNYQIRVLCCDDYSHCPSTPKPGTTATLSTTERLSVPSSSPSATSPTPETTSALLGTTPGPYTATSTATGPSATAQTTPILTSGPTTSAATATGCQPRCTWTGWLDQSYPMSGASGGDFETYANIRAAGGSVCERPVALQCRAERLPDVPLQELDQVVLCDLEVGLVCRNQDQGGRVKMCLNYQIRVLCCDDYSHCPSTPKPGTTATLSSTGSETAGTTGFRTTTTTPPLPSAPGTTETVSKATTETGPSSAKTERVTIPTAETGPSTSRTTQSVPGTQTPRTSLSTTERLSVPSSSPSATSPTPETTSALLGTTPGPYTATSTAMGPSATAQTTPILTSGPAATATGCQPRCTWTGWLDQSYPMSGASGGDFETYANIRAAGGSVCERPVALQCRAERLPDVPLQELDQVVQCDLDVGLVCRNQDQGGRFKMCLNYQIRVLCCDDYSHCPSTPKPGTTATLSTTERLSVPSSSPSATSPTPETTSALLGTTPGPYTATSTATGPSATAQTTPILTSGPTTSAATATGCQPRCTWTGWLDQSYPMSGASGGDFETYANIRAAGGSVCERPVALQCRAERLPDVPLQELDQVVQCDLDVGLVCRNQDQGGRVKMCLNYQIRVLCCDDYSHCPSTPKPGTTATLSSTGSETAGTTGFRTTTTTPPLPSAPGTTETVSKATTETGPSSAKTERVTIPTAETGPSTSRTTQSVPGTQTPRTSLSTTERLSVPSSSPSATSPTPETTSALLGTTPGPYTATSTATGPSATAQTTPILTSGPTTSAATATGCQPRCTWTGWLDQSYPMSGASGGDFETYANIRAAGGSVCERPVSLQCRAERLPDVPLQELDQVVLCDLEVGLVCRNQDQGGRFKMCLNYQIRVLCCDDYSHCPSTATTGVSSRETFVTSPIKTTPAILSTHPTIGTVLPSSTLKPTLTSLTSMTSTTSLTSGICTPQCTWTDWFDEDYPTPVPDGGDFETLSALRRAGHDFCQQPQDIECRAEVAPDMSLEHVGQVVQCDVRFGLVCRNRDQPGPMQYCHNYHVRLLCCDSPCAPSLSPETTTSPSILSTLRPSASPGSLVSTVPCFCQAFGQLFLPGDVVYNRTDSAGCHFYAVCNQHCELDRFQGACPTSSPPEPPTSLPLTSPAPGCDLVDPPRQVNESWTLENCTVARCEGDNHIVLLEPKPVAQVTCVNGHLPVKVQSEQEPCQYHYECECTCSSWGGSNYITFDGTSYSFRGNCTYVLMREIRPLHGNLTILLYKQYCPAAVASTSCPIALSIHYKSTEVILATTTAAGGQEEGLVLFDGTRVSQGFSKDGVSVSVTTSTRMQVDIPAIGVSVTLDGQVFQIQLSYSNFNHNTEGQCGTCTNSKTDDCRRPDGTMAPTCQDMAGSWLVPESSKEGCLPPTGLPTTTSPPSSEPTTPISTSCPPAPLCQLMLSHIFAECHKLIPPSLFFSICVKDACQAGHPEVPCQSLEAYAGLCRARGVCSDWRNATGGLCDFTCPPEKVYKPCGPVQPTTCDSRTQSPESKGLAEGCFCPDGLTLFNAHTDVCVPECPCVGPDGFPKFPGERWISNCQACVCNEGSVTVQCVPVQCEAQDPPPECSQAGFVTLTRPLANNPCCQETLCVCNTTTCPKNPPECGPGEELAQIHEEGSCCPTFICRPKLCTYNGIIYGIGATFPGAIPCHTCTCLSADTQDPTVQCEEDTCNTTCPQGSEYSTVAGQCCGECVQTACLTPDGWLVQPNQTWVNSLVDNCTEYHCQVENGVHVLIPRPPSCPDVSSCRGILRKTGCCYSCEEVDSCQVHINRTVLGHRGCKAPVNLTFCEGSCPGVSKYSPEAQAMQRRCTCCQESRAHEEEVTLQCPDGTAIRHTYTHIDECKCALACIPAPATQEDSIPV